jgi:hypothetical protein
MSLNIPLQLNGTPIQDLGPEFVKSAELDRDRGLILPTIRDNVDFNNFYSTEYISSQLSEIMLILIIFILRNIYLEYIIKMLF